MQTTNKNEVPVNKINKLLSSLILLILFQPGLNRLQADESSSAVTALFNRLGVAVHEACQSERDNGLCWQQSLLYALKHRNESQVHPLLLSEEVNLNLAPFREFPPTQWQPAHLLNAALVQMFEFSILTIELTEEGYIHIVLASPSENGYEHTVLFYLPAQNTAAPGFDVDSILQSYLQAADVTLFLTPGHVQPVVSTERQQVDEDAVAIETRNDRLLLAGFIQGKLNSVDSVQGGGIPSMWQDLRPNFDAVYGAARQKKSVLPDDVKARHQKAHQRQRASERHRYYIKRAIAVALVATGIGAGIQYRSELEAFLKPYWNNREYYIAESRKQLSTLSAFLQHQLSELHRSSYPYWLSAKAMAWDFWLRYYWQIDLSGCSQGQGVVVISDRGKGFRTTGLINDQPVNLLVDTGADIVHMNARTASKLGIALSGDPQICRLALEIPVSCHHVILKTVQVGCFKLFNVKAVVSTGSYKENEVLLLGRSFTNRLNINTNKDIMSIKAD